MRLCGISSRFQLLSPCTGQVTHALLTRPPLSPYHLPPEGFRRYVFVRLACVRHAASVHPEPGSNSQIKCLRCQIKVQNHWFFSCHYCLFRFWTFVLFHGLSCRHHSQENPNEIWINVQGCFVIQLSRFCVVLFLWHNFFILSHSEVFVKNFFNLFFNVLLLFLSNSYILSHSHSSVKHFFIFLLYFPNKSEKYYGEGGIWTLAPRERSTPLAGAPLQPLEYFSIMPK